MAFCPTQFYDWPSKKACSMLIQYHRKKLLNTTFQDENGRPFLRTKTTYRFCMPATTQLIRINTAASFDSDDLRSEKSSAEHRDRWESERVLVTINWKWPSDKKSTVTFQGLTMSLKQFLERGPGWLNNDAYFNMNSELFVWKSNRFNPRLFNARTREEVATYHRGEATENPVSRPSKLNSFVIISPTVSDHRDSRVLDAVLVTFFLYKATRDFTLPFMPRWWFGIQHADVSTMLRCSRRMEIFPAKSWRSVTREPTEKEVPLDVC